MSHTVSVNLIADQEIEVGGVKVNVHDIGSVIVDTYGVIVNCHLVGCSGEEYDYKPNSWLNEQMGYPV